MPNSPSWPQTEASWKKRRSVPGDKLDQREGNTVAKKLCLVVATMKSSPPVKSRQSFRAKLGKAEMRLED